MKSHLPYFLILLFIASPLIAQDNAILIEAENATALGADYNTVTEDDVTFITSGTDFIDPSFPTTADKVASFDVTFAAAGDYEVYVKLRVGPDAANDDSFLFAQSLGQKDVNLAEDWSIVNNIATGALADDDYVTSEAVASAAGNFVWINAAEVGQGGPFIFTVGAESLTQTFQIAQRENGLDIDKIAFGNANLFYTVANLENEEAGAIEVTDPNKTDPIATGHDKFLGSAYSGSQSPQFNWHWNQLTPENAGKWESVEGNRDQMNWGGMDAAYDYAKDNGFPIRFHVLIWGNQQPAWIEELPAEEQLEEIREWIEAVALRYPDLDVVEVVNEPLHDPPRGEGNGNYIEALGGDGETGWDWIIKSFEIAREFFPSTTKLMLNDYSITNSTPSTNDYIEIIKLLQERQLIDEIGVQAHAFSTGGSINTITTNLNLIGTETGLPITATEMDIDGGTPDNPDDYLQLERYQRIFPGFWENEHVNGITMWGYRTGLWRQDQAAYTINSDATFRPALTWLRAYVEGTFVEATSITLGVPALEVDIDATLQFTATLAPTEATIGAYEWSVEDGTGSATIDENGLVTGVSAGTVDVIATALDGSGVSATLQITVQAQITGIEEESSQLLLYPNPVTNQLLTLEHKDFIHSVKIYDINGQTVRELNGLNTQQLSVRLNVEPGIYALLISDQSGWHSRKIIVN